MDELIIINRNPQQSAFEFSNSTAIELHNSQQPKDIWKTCLRQILFTTTEQIEDVVIFPEDQIYKSDKAISFLAEILCGLHSPVFGETEVFGQFKTFVEQQNTEKSNLVYPSAKWVRFLYEQVKSIRTQYMTGIGSNSYGSTLRKLTRDTASLSILGAGQLATEILPWVSKNKKIQILVRNTEKYISLTQTYNELVIENIHQVKEINQALIIAAPIENNDLIQLISICENKPDFIYDLRNSGFEELRQNLKNIKMLSLADFFEIFNEDKIKFEKLKFKIQNIISDKSIEFMNRSEIRPLGWDDLCL